MRFRVDIDDRAAERALKGLLRRGENLEPVLRSVGETLLNSTRERFRSQESPEGVPWAPLKPSTLARKTENRDKILTERGTLRNEIAYRLLDAHTVGLGAGGGAKKYANTHQFGRGAIVARPFLGVSAEDAADIRDEILDFLADASP